jgi:HPt (histidine-containing phosphotransfer) domain-containing protein
MKSGMDDYISKPFKVKDLIKIVTKWTAHNSSKLEEIPASIQDEKVDENIQAILEKLANDLMSDKEFVYDVYNEFVDSIPGTFEKIKTAIDKSDFKTITVSAHTLKGASGSLHILGLSKLAADLEALGKAENISLCTEEFEKVKSYCNNKITRMN